MKRWFFICLAVACLASLAINSALAEKRLALVIGINDYKEVPKLEKAVGDADAIGDKLEKLGFQVTKALNPDRRALNLALSKLYGEIEPGDTVLVHYSGHGIEIAGQNFLLPADIPAPETGQEDLLKSESLPLSMLVDTLGEKGAGVRILIIDACRDNPFAKGGKRSLGGTRGLAAVEPPKGTFIMYSAGTGQSALDRLDDNDAAQTSVYTRVLLNKLDLPGLQLRDLADSVRKEVDKETKSVGHDQRPAYYDDLSEDFSFSPAIAKTGEVTPEAASVITTPKPLVEPSPSQPGLGEAEAYKLSQSIDTVEGWNAFLGQFPDGKYAPFATAAKEKLVAALKPAQKPRAVDVPQEPQPTDEPDTTQQPDIAQTRANSCRHVGRVRGLNPNGDGFLSVRSGPSSDYDELDRLFNGNTVSICSISNGWLHVKYHSGAIGWVFGKFVARGG